MVKDIIVGPTEIDLDPDQECLKEFYDCYIGSIKGCRLWVRQLSENMQSSGPRVERIKRSIGGGLRSPDVSILVSYVILREDKLFNLRLDITRCNWVPVCEVYHCKKQQMFAVLVDSVDDSWISTSVMGILRLQVTIRCWTSRHQCRCHRHLCLQSIQECILHQ